MSLEDKFMKEAMASISDEDIEFLISLTEKEWELIFKGMEKDLLNDDHNKTC